MKKLLLWLLPNFSALLLIFLLEGTLNYFHLIIAFVELDNLWRFYLYTSVYYNESKPWNFLRYKTLIYALFWFAILNQVFYTKKNTIKTQVIH
jgi:hypothetical protein